MILQEEARKINIKLHQVVKKLKEFSNPDRKFLCDILFGLFSTGSFNLMSISRVLPYEINIRYIHKRLQRHISSGGRMQECINNNILSLSKTSITDETYLYLDGGDFTYIEASTYEKMTTVRDGSKGVYKQGYVCNLLLCDTGSELIPLNYYVYSRADASYKSDNFNTLQVIENYIKFNGSKGCWVLDRGYDSKLIMNYLYDNNARFIIRQCHNRKVTYNGKEILIKDLCLNYKLKHSSKTGKYHYKHCYLDYIPVTVVYHKKETDIAIICSGHLDKKEAEKSIVKYFKRWCVEDGHRFMKQAFGLEKAQISTFNGIKCIASLALLAWYILKCVEHDKELEYIAMKNAKQNKKKIVKFIYYRLVEGIRSVLKYITVNYCIKKKKNNKNIQKILSIQDFFKDYGVTIEWV